MPNAKDYFEKQGGIGLLKQYWRNGALGTSLAQFLLLGRSKTALELLRLSANLKTKQKLERKYRKVLRDFDSRWDEKTIHQARKTVWVFWWQGVDSMPLIVKHCYASLKENLKDWEIILLTEQNYKEYAVFPDFITNKLQKGITLTHFSDLLRLELLKRHGGLWIDSTVLCTSGDVPKSITNSDLFVFRPQKPGSDGASIYISSWFMWAKSNNRIIMATQAMLYDYWQKNDTLTDYYLLHYFMSIAFDYYKEDAKEIPAFCNSVPHLLQLHFFEPYDEDYWEDIKKMTSFHKLSYKFDKERLEKEGTYYKKIIEDEGIKL